MNCCCSGLRSWRIMFVVGLLCTFGLAGGWFLFKSEARLGIDHDHGWNLVHEHPHTHDGQLNHDHWHRGISRVTHSHEHQHGHEHDSMLDAPANGSLVQFGHVHAEGTKVYWVKILKNKTELELNFLVEVDGVTEPLTIESNSVEGELFFESKSFGSLNFVKNNGTYWTTLPGQLPEFGSSSVVIPCVSVAGRNFPVKFSVPKS